MPKIFPFKAFHYDTRTVPNLSDVITPPYDTISEKQAIAYRTRSPYNFAHVDLPSMPEESYKRSSELLTKWREHHILATDDKPGYYLYRQTFKLDGKSHVRDLLMCTVLLTDFSEGSVRPHENTFGKPKADRLQILRQTKTNLSQVFGMVKDPQGFLNSLYERWEFSTPLLHGITDDGTNHAVWKVDPAKATGLQEFFETQPIYIVDGHHRYESALAYAREVGAYGDSVKSAGKMLFAIANAYDPGLVVLPTHRVVKKLGDKAPTLSAIEKAYSLTEMSFEDLKSFTADNGDTPDFGLYIDKTLFRCSPKHWENEAKTEGQSLYRLAVHWSDRHFLPELCGVNDENRADKISYEKDLNQTWEHRDHADLVIFHAPPGVADIMKVADDKQFMPQKSTYFYPKLAAGLIMRDIGG